MKRFLLSLFILSLGLKVGLVAQIATMYAEKTYPDNTRICYFVLDNMPSAQQKAFVIAEAKNNENLFDLFFYEEEKVVFFHSVVEWTLDSVVNFINNALNPYPEKYRIQSITAYIPVPPNTDIWENPRSNVSLPSSIGIFELVDEPQFDDVLPMSEEPQFLSNAPQRGNAPQRAPAPPIYPSGGDPCLDITAINACGSDNMQRVIFYERGNAAFDSICAAAALGQEKIFSFTTPEAMQIKFAVTNVSGSFNLMLLQGSDCSTDTWQCVDIINRTKAYNANLGIVPAGTTVHFMFDAIDTTQTEISFYIPCANDLCYNITPITVCGKDSIHRQHVTFSGKDETDWGSSSCGTLVSSGQKKIFSYTTPRAMEFKLAVTSVSGNINFLYLQNGDCFHGIGQWICKDNIYANVRGVYDARLGIVPAGTTVYFMLDAVDTTETEISFYVMCANETLCDFAAAIPLGCCLENEQTVTLRGSGSSAWNRNPCDAAAIGREIVFEFTPLTTGHHNLVVTSATGGYIDYFWRKDNCAPPVVTNDGPPVVWNWTCINGNRGINTTGTYYIGRLVKDSTYYIVLDAGNTGARTHSFWIDCPNEAKNKDTTDCTTPLDQPNGCIDAEPFCTNNYYCFPAAVDVPSIGHIGCCYTTKNAAWYWMRIATPGDLTIYMEQRDAGGNQKDIDFIAWGPFNSLDQACALKNMNPVGSNCHGDPALCTGSANYPQGNVVDCCWCALGYEYLYIHNAQAGEVYLLLMQNYANVPANISFSKIGGTATTDCSIVEPQVGSNTPLCVGETLKLTSAPGDMMCVTYHWRGPNGWTSKEQNPIIPNVTLADAGRYTLQIESGGMFSAPHVLQVRIGAPADTTFIYDTICANKLPYRKYNYVVNTAGTHIKNLITNAHNPLGSACTINKCPVPHCDSIVVLNLVVNPISTFEYRDTICKGDSILFGGTWRKTAGTYTHIAPNSYGCDSTTKLHLYVKEVTTFNRSADICIGETYTLNGESYTYPNAGTYIETQYFGCDSIIIITLTVGNVNEKTIDEVICFGSEYDFYDRIINADAEGDFTYTHTVFMDGSCDTLVTLNLTVKVCSHMNIVSIDEICADDENIILNFRVSEGELAFYSVTFKGKAKEPDADFKDIVRAPISFGDKLEIPITQFSHPKYAKPDLYEMEIIFYFTDGTHRTFDTIFTVLYPSWIIQQKWNDVLALLNKDNNGGYEWDSYKWYKSGTQMVDEIGAYIYIKDGFLDFNAEYCAELVRKDESFAIRTCCLIPQKRENSSSTPSVISPSLVPNNSIMEINSQEGGKITIYHVSGIVVGRQNLQAGENSIKTPAQQGFYIMVVEEKNQEPIKQVLVVK